MWLCTKNKETSQVPGGRDTDQHPLVGCLPVKMHTHVVFELMGSLHAQAVSDLQAPKPEPTPQLAPASKYGSCWESQYMGRQAKPCPRMKGLKWVDPLGLG